MKIIEKALLSLIVVVFFSATSVCQDRCGTDIILEELGKEKPTLLLEYEKSFRDFYAHSTRNLEDPDCPIIIPVHVVILHNPEDSIGQGTNLSKDRILSQIEVLNQDFSRTNPDRDQTPPEFNVGDTGIRFYLASVDPDGNTTDGITRYQLTEKYNIGETPSIRNTRTKIKEKTGWTRDIYLNIWVAPTIDVLGFAKVPTQTFLPKWNDDGANIHTEIFGGPGFATRENYDMGRTLTHEVGHYLGLGHIWRSNGCTLDDGIADTPLQNSANIGCPSHPTYSCGNEGDMFMNYMDYTNDACMNAFTIDQGSYMRNILSTSRSSLLTAAGYACPDKLLIVMQMLTSEHPTCHGGDDGMIEVTACGGANDDYKYSIDGGPYKTRNIFTGLKAGVHLISVKNLFGIKGELTITLEDPELIYGNNIEIQSPTCDGSKSGSITINNGDETQLSYSIDGNNFISNPKFENLAAGSYTISIKNSNGCIEKIDTFIQHAPKLDFNVVEMISPLCNGDKNGRIVLSALGGVAPFSYSLDGTHFQNDSVFSELNSGIYAIQIKDKNSCVFTKEYKLTEPEKFEISIENTKPISCFNENNGAITILTKGGTGKSMVSINNDAFTTNHFFDNLSAGIYNFTSSDENGCSSTFTYMLSEPEPLIINEIYSTDVKCVGDKNGSIEIPVSGGTPQYIYQLGNKTQILHTFSDLEVGIYPIIVTDQNKCTSESEAIIKTQSEILLEVLEVYSPNCFGESNGKALLKGDGGNGEYSYSMDNINFQKDPYFDNLRSGTTLLYIKDENSCVATVPVKIPTPPKIEILELLVVQPTCETNNDGGISLSFQGGNGSLLTKVNGSFSEVSSLENLTNGNYLIEIIDENFCKVDSLITLNSPKGIDISLLSITETNCEFNLLGTATFMASGENNTFFYNVEDQINSSGFFENLGGGRKKLIVNDPVGCTAEFEFDIPIVGGLNIELIEMVRPKCFNSNDGKFTINASGGQKEYVFNLGPNTNTSGIFDNIQGGIHKIIVEDNFGCSGELVVQLDSPERLSLDTVFLKKPVCFNDDNGIIDADAQGGKSPILYTLNNRRNYSGVFTGLKSGTYPIIMTDANGCEVTENITLNQPERIKAINIDLQSPKCYGDNNGLISFDVAGGVGNKLIHYKDQIFDGSIILSKLSAGNYRVRMSDQNKCNELLDIFLEEPAELISQDTTIVPETYQTLGQLSVTYSGGTRPYLFALNNGDYVSENTFSELMAGNYAFHIIDANECSDKIYVNVPYDDSFENPEGSVSNIWISHNRSNENHLHFKLHGDQAVWYSLFSIDGKTMYSANHTFLSGQHSLKLPVDQYPPGTYLIRFNAERDYKNLKFIKL